MTPTEEKERQETLSQAYAGFQKGLVTHAFYKIHSQEISDDLVQETFLKTWRYLVKGGKVDIMKAFLYHVLNNLIVDEYRKRKVLSLDVLLDAGYTPSADHREQFFDMLDGKAALLLIQRLPVHYQKVMRMRYVQSLSLAEMSLLTGKSKNAMAVQVHRGLAKLKQLYMHA